MARRGKLRLKFRRLLRMLFRTDPLVAVSTLGERRVVVAPTRARNFRTGSDNLLKVHSRDSAFSPSPLPLIRFLILIGRENHTADYIG